MWILNFIRAMTGATNLLSRNLVPGFELELLGAKSLPEVPQEAISKELGEVRQIAPNNFTAEGFRSFEYLLFPERCHVNVP